MRAEPFLMPAHIAALPERRAQIDGLRAIAMAGVLYVHFWNDHPVTEFLRVSLFFTVSGFLITHMLWKARAEGGALLPLNFYIRRALRLFPALAVLVAFGILFDIDGFRGRAFWHLFQLSNLSFPYYQDVRPFVTGHLCVETTMTRTGSSPSHQVTPTEVLGREGTRQATSPLPRERSAEVWMSPRKQTRPGEGFSRWSKA